MGGEDKVNMDDMSLCEKISYQWGRFKHFLYNSDKGTVMGRTGNSWAKIGFFYFIYYTCLACFWAAMLFIFLQTVDYNRPKYNAYVSTPDLNFVPAAKENKIQFTPDNESTYKKYITKLTELYEEINSTSQAKEGCPDGDPRCTFDLGRLGKFCTPQNNFGFDKGEPCLLVNLNKVYNWEPEDYAPEDIPEEVADIYEPGNIAIACDAYKEKYAKNYNSTIVYPSEGISAEYFPYNPKEVGGKKNYATPWVAIRFKIMKETKVECRTYTGNIKPKTGLYDTDQESKFVVQFNIKQTSGSDEL